MQNKCDIVITVEYDDAWGIPIQWMPTVTGQNKNEVKKEHVEQ